MAPVPRFFLLPLVFTSLLSVNGLEKLSLGVGLGLAGNSPSSIEVGDTVQVVGIGKIYAQDTYAREIDGRYGVVTSLPGGKSPMRYEIRLTSKGLHHGELTRVLPAFVKLVSKAPAPAPPAPKPAPPALAPDTIVQLINMNAPYQSNVYRNRSYPECQGLQAKIETSYTQVDGSLRYRVRVISNGIRYGAVLHVAVDQVQPVAPAPTPSPPPPMAPDTIVQLINMNKSYPAYQGLHANIETSFTKWDGSLRYRVKVISKGIRKGEVFTVAANQVKKP